jgi:hypothetical protein
LFDPDEGHMLVLVWCIGGYTIVRDSARIQYKLMRFMVYFEPAENKHLLLHEYSSHVYTWEGISRVTRCLITAS